MRRLRSEAVQPRGARRADPGRGPACRAHSPGTRRIVAGGLEIDGRTRRATLFGVPLKLSHKEFELLATLAAEPERLFTKVELLRDIWDWPATMRTRTLDSHVSRLRRKLRAIDPQVRYVDNQWGVGYRLVGLPE